MSRSAGVSRSALSAEASRGEAACDLRVVPRTLQHHDGPVAKVARPEPPELPGAPTEWLKFNLGPVAARSGDAPRSASARVPTCAPRRDAAERAAADSSQIARARALARETRWYDTFPQGFEAKRLNLRQIHARLLQSLRDRNSRLEQEQRQEIARVTAATILTNTPPASERANSGPDLSDSMIRIGTELGASITAQEQKLLLDLANAVRDLP